MMMASQHSDGIVSRFADTPTIREFNVSNHLLGDRAALEAAWERDGYWFFRDVLDKDAVARVRATYREVLEALDVVEAGDPDQTLYNGAALDDYPIKMGGDPTIDPLLARYPSGAFLAEPPIRHFFEQVFGDEVMWVPNSEFHAVPPNPAHQGSRFNFVHCDGANNKGLALRICWIPLSDIDEETGGLALAEGMHKPRMNDFPRPAQGIRESDVPVDAWRRAIYAPGDVLMFSLETPHSGLANRSDKYFRLSMDVRGMPKSANIPVVGHVAAIDHNAIAVDADDGQHHVFRIDDDTFCRIYRGRQSGMPLTRDEIPQLVHVGAPVYVAADHGTAVFIRPSH
ncbi:phytanoyl-CoA dioxygenase family protein [Sphingobium sp. AEW001]|uniref:phytanoyl-CoA dioxygenase family protein n=2 Tax=Sphingobium TaxID=165695 RepID=UPI0015E66295|nr:phytanoyl-CoA dioxygenase family protein [Sphingobium sp. AEW001]